MATYFLATSYNDNSIPNYYKNLAKELDRQGHTVIVIYDGESSEAVGIFDNIIQYTWPSKRPTKFKDAMFLHKLIRLHKPDCLLSNFGSVTLMTLVGWLNGVSKRVAWYHTLSEQISMDDTSLSLVRSLKNTRKNIIYALCTTMIPVSKYAKDDCIKAYGIPEQKLHVLYNLLTDSLGEREYQKEKNKLVCVGRLDRSKGQDVLIHAVSKLVSKIPSIRVEFIGHGPEEEQYKELAKTLKVANNCLFLGQKPMEDVFLSMGTSEICIVPSYIDNLPTVSLEAQALGTPVIVGSTGGMPETMKNEETGYAITPGNPDLLAEKIELILTNEDLSERISENARNFFLNELSYKKLPSYVQYFESL